MSQPDLSKRFSVDWGAAALHRVSLSSAVLTVASPKILSAREKCYNHLRFTLMPNVRLGTNVFSQTAELGFAPPPEVFGSFAFFSSEPAKMKRIQRETIP